MKTAFSIIAITLFAACSRQAQSPIVFSLQTNEVSMTLQLDTNGTFVQKNKHEKSIQFHEEGTYTLTDSSVVLHYNNPSYSYNCFDVPITATDTFLFINYKQQTYLVRSSQPTAESSRAFMQQLKQSLQNNTFNLFENDYNLPHSSGNLQLIYTPK